MKFRDGFMVEKHDSGHYEYTDDRGRTFELRRIVTERDASHAKWELLLPDEAPVVHRTKGEAYKAAIARYAQ